MQLKPYRVDLPCGQKRWFDTPEEALKAAVRGGMVIGRMVREEGVPLRPPATRANVVSLSQARARLAR